MDGPLNPIPGVADLDECADPEMHDCPVGKIVIAKHFYSLVFYSYAIYAIKFLYSQPIFRTL